MLLFLMTLLIGCGEKETDSASDTATTEAQ